MSTSETTTHPICKCPCGSGDIVKHVTSQDNPWSSADVLVEIACPDCADAWRIDNGSLVLRNSEREASATRGAVDAAVRRLRELISTLIENYFVAFSAKTKKAELNEIVRLGLGENDYRRYVRNRGRGMAIAECCYALRNVEWLRSQAETVGQLDDLNALIGAKTKAEEAHKSAYAKIVRRKIA